MNMNTPRDVHAGGLTLAIARKDPAVWLAGLALKGGGIARLPLGPRGLLGRSFWVVSDPHLLRQVLLTNSGNYDKDGPLFGVIRRALGKEGWFTTNDEDLLRMLRGRMLPVLQRNNLAGAVDTVALMTRRRVEAWDSRQPVLLFEEVRRLNIEFLITYMFGVEADVAKIARLTAEVFAGMAGGLFLPLWVPGSKKYAESIKALVAEIEIVIMHRRARGVVGTDLLGALLEIEPKLTDAQVRDQVMTVLMAGHDSTAASLAWGFIRLSERPDIYGVLHAEVSSVIGKRLPALTDLWRLPELQRFVRSVFHDRPAFPLYPRNAVSEDWLGGKLIRPGDQMIISPYAAHHNPRVWGGFDHFYEQWQAGLTKEQRRAHLPFGEGKRKCPGEDLATCIAVTIIAIVVQRVESLRRVTDHSAQQVHFAMTAAPADHAAMYVTMR